MPTWERCIPFRNPWNEVEEQYYGRTSSITKKEVITKGEVSFFQFLITLIISHDRQISPPFRILQLVQSLSFYTPKGWKRCPFWPEPLHIGHYRQHFLPPLGPVFRITDFSISLYERSIKSFMNLFINLFF